MISLNVDKTLLRQIRTTMYPHFTDEETKIQRGPISLGLESGSLIPNPGPPTTLPNRCHKPTWVPTVVMANSHVSSKTQLELV